MSFTKTKVCSILTLSLFTFGPPSLVNSQSSASSADSNVLSMSLAHDSSASGPHADMQMTVTFTNTTHTDLTFVPGMTIDCRRLPSKTSLVRRNLTDPKGNLHHHLPYMGDGPPYIGYCAGRIDPFVVVLQAHKSISLPLDLSKYFDLTNAKQYDMARFPAGNYPVEAEFTGDAQPLPHIVSWAGTIESNAIKVRFNSEFAAGLADYPR